MPHSDIDERTRKRAQSLRRQPTRAESKLWPLLRAMKPLGFHFRRQAPIGAYVVDFAWLAGKLVIEVDGGQHSEATRAHDDRRSAWLRSQGYQVLRFWNSEVLRSLEAVGEVILKAAESRRTPALTPPHKGEGK
ncbi:MAG: DUF559 domain-containing protein [Xanthobacteraceae bacterium]